MSRPSNPAASPWNGVIYYGEVFGFLLAWVVGVGVASYYAGSGESTPDWSRLASAGAGQGGSAPGRGVDR
ncbi:MAG: hypothetical protein ACRCT8_13450 [Lacipirellulaceae bacterium]